MKIKLYEFGPTRSIRVRWTLQELGLAFESVRINLLAGEHRRPEFLKINPAGKIPVLVDDAVVLTESVAIVLYLSEKYADKRRVMWFTGRVMTLKRSEPCRKLPRGKCDPASASSDPYWRCGEKW